MRAISRVSRARVGRYGTMLSLRSYRFARVHRMEAAAMEVMRKNVARVVIFALAKIRIHGLRFISLVEARPMF